LITFLELGKCNRLLDGFGQTQPVSEEDFSSLTGDVVWVKTAL
jgi:hypothetical protein